METLLQDLRVALRRLRASPGFTGVATLTLALAIGANVAIFTVVNAVLLRPLPYPDAERIVWVHHHAPGLELEELETSVGLIEHYREGARTLTPMAGVVTRGRNLTGGDRPARVRVAEVTPELFDVLATRPALGRPFLASDVEEGAAAVAILTHAAWQSRFGGAPDIIGRRVEVDGRSTEIVGVMPPGFAFPEPETALLLPLRLDPALGFGTFGIRGLARLAPGVELDAARRELAALQHRIPERFPEITADWLDRAGWSVSLEPLRDRVVGDAATTLWVLFGTVGLVLLVAGANVANLFLVRADARRREMAVRAALGASGGRIARTFLAESVLVGLPAGILGVLIAMAGVGLLVAHGPAELPRLHEVGVDGRVLAFAAALSVIAGLALGALPLPRLARQSSAALLRSGGRGSTAGRERHRARRLLIVSQMALALVLLVSAGLMLRSVARLHAVDPGFRAEGVLAVGVSLGDDAGRERAVAFYHRVLDEVAGLPGVASVGATNGLPIETSGTNGGSFRIESRPTADDELPPVAMWTAVTDGYFRTLGIPLLEGRAPVRSDAQGGRPVAWVNETFARRFLDGHALGERLRFGADTTWAEVVGVVGDVRAFGLDEEVPPMAYLPMTTTATATALELMHLVVRTDGAPAALALAIRAAVDRVDPTVPLTTVRPMEEILASSLARTSFTMALLAVAAGLALVLGVVGLYGVISYIVSQRTTEFGIRIALGARPTAVRAMVLREGLALALAGVIVGLIAAVATTRLLASLLFEVSAHDPATFAAVAAVLTGVSLLATYVPARVATRVDPMRVLRTD